MAVTTGVAARLRQHGGSPASVTTVTTKEGDLVVGPGGWCWFQRPRAVIDSNGVLWLGSTQGHSGGQPGAVEVTGVDLTSGTHVATHRLGTDRVDDHTSPSVLAVGSDLQVGWAPHRNVNWLRLGHLGEPLTTVVRPGAVEAPGRGTSYISAHLVQGRRWVLYRGEQFSWNLLSSTDGTTWAPCGLIISPPPGGHRPYVVATSAGDRLHLLVSTGNPSEQRGTSVGHAVVHADLSITDAAGRPLGRVGTNPPSATTLPTVVDGASGRDEPHDTDVWICDLQMHRGRPTGVLSVRDPWPATSAPSTTTTSATATSTLGQDTPAPDPGTVLASGPPSVGRWRHAYRWARLQPDGTWAVEHLAWAGSELYGNQPDYTGLASVDPTDANAVVLSTNVHPATGQPLVSAADGNTHWELFAGRRRATAPSPWSWTPLTTNSTADNLRPVIVAGNGHRAVAWMRGTYRSWFDFDTQLMVRAT